jgi:HEAT repeat protein/peroxiredoxin
MGVLLIIGVILPMKVLAAHKEKSAKTEASSKQMTKEGRKTLGKELRDLALRGDEESFAKLAQYALDQTPEIRQQAAIALGWSKHKEAMDLLLTLAHDGNQNVRGAAVLGLGMKSDPRAYDAVMIALEKDESSEVKGRAAFALGQMKDEKAQDKLLECMKSNLTAVRRSAAMALGKADDTRVIEPLIKALGDPEDEVRKSAAKSLKILTGQDALYASTENKPRDEAQRGWQDWWDENNGTFKIVVKHKRGPSSVAREWIEKYDANKDGSLNEQELHTALDDMVKGRAGLKKGDVLAKDMTIRNLDGSEATLSGLLKGPTVIYYFLSTCPHCVKAEGFIGKLAEDNKGGKIAFLGIAASREKLEGLKGYVERTKWGFPVVLDEKKKFSGKNHIGGTPTVVIIDSSGKIIDSYRGLPDDKREELTKRMAELSKTAS